MALGLSTQAAGDFESRIQYDARAGRFTRIDRVQASDGSFDNFPTDITSVASFAMDFKGIEVGWINFSGGAPDFAMVPVGSTLPQQPSKDHKQGFRIRLKLGRTAGGDVRTWSHTAKCVLGAVNELHDAVLADPNYRAGKLPVVRMTGSVPVKGNGGAGKNSTNYAPVFVIDSWIDRPADFDTKTEANGSNGHAQPAAAPQTNNPVPPPVQPAPAAVSHEF